MKKLFYIALVIVLLLVIGKLVKQDSSLKNVPAAAVETSADINAVVADPLNPDVIGDGEVVDDEAEEVEETNPDETADEDETIIKE